MQITPHPIKRAVLYGGFLWLIISPIIWLALHFNQYTGDLTRIGQWREVDFGWKSPQAIIEPSQLLSSSIAEADILVIGDSFSEPLIWQSVLVEKGWKVTTVSWSQIGDLCEDISAQLHAAGFRGRHIIIQSAERLVNRQFMRSAACQSTPSWPTDLSERKVIAPPVVVNDTEDLYLQGQFVAGLKTLYHSLALNYFDTYYHLHNWRSKNTHIYPLADGCQYFSHQKCQWGLFFSDDYRQASLTVANLKDLVTLNKRLPNYQVIWLIIPNKSSIYQRKIDASFWSDLAAQRLGPDLYSFFQTQKAHVIDLYAPNDTHLSINGYRSLGLMTLESLKK